VVYSCNPLRNYLFFYPKQQLVQRSHAPYLMRGADSYMLDDCNDKNFGICEKIVRAFISAEQVAGEYDGKALARFQHLSSMLGDGTDQIKKIVKGDRKNEIQGTPVRYRYV
jgi:hypothetical protein